MDLRPTLLALLLAAAGLLAVATVTAADRNQSTDTQAQPSQARLEYGAYLALAGNCVGCHTRPGGDPLAGGVELETPFGIIYTPNITSHERAGIGAFSDEDFLRAMQQGAAPDGIPYYPAFPYASFSKVSDDDLLAIKDYLFSLPASGDRPPKTRLRWPFDAREQLFGWQELYLTPDRFQPSEEKSEEWNRGAYLTQGLAHCGACHIVPSPGASLDRAAVSGGSALRGWAAPNPAPEIDAALGERSLDELVALLRTGGAEPAPALTTHQAHGNLSQLASSDVRAIAVYLKDPAPEAEVSAAQRLDGGPHTQGSTLYLHYCGACHQRYGQGTAPYFPALRGSQSMTAAEPSDALKSILLGAPAEPAEAYSAHVVMPSFGSLLNDEQIAAIASYIRASWGNQAAPISAKQVAEIRAGGR